jgi:hypothetical protein
MPPAIRSGDTLRRQSPLTQDSQAMATNGRRGRPQPGRVCRDIGRLSWRIFRYPHHRLYLSSCRFAEGRERQRPGSASETGSDSCQSPVVHLQTQRSVSGLFYRQTTSSCLPKQSREVRGSRLSWRLFISLRLDDHRSDRNCLRAIEARASVELSAMLLQTLAAALVSLQ